MWRDRPYRAELLRLSPITSFPVRGAIGPSAPTSSEVLVRLHVEPHGEERELRAGDQQERDEDDRGRRDAVPEDPQHDLRDPEAEAEQRHQESEHVEEDERVEVADHVLLAQPPEEALPEQPRDSRHDPSDLDTRALADA